MLALRASPRLASPAVMKRKGICLRGIFPGWRAVFVISFWKRLFFCLFWIVNCRSWCHFVLLAYVFYKLHIRTYSHARTHFIILLLLADQICRCFFALDNGTGILYLFPLISFFYRSHYPLSLWSQMRIVELKRFEICDAFVKWWNAVVNPTVVFVPCSPHQPLDQRISCSWLQKVSCWKTLWKKGTGMSVYAHTLTCGRYAHTSVYICTCIHRRIRTHRREVKESVVWESFFF